ncbi:MAG: hypothetical protein ABIJ56_13220 [Pseudomonadota bacterium]
MRSEVKTFAASSAPILCFLIGLACVSCKNRKEQGAEAGQPVDAAKILGLASTAAEAIDHHELKALTMINIASVQARAGKNRKALDMLERAMKTAGAIDSDVEKSSVTAAAAVAYAGAGKHEKGIELAASISEPQMKAEALAGIARHLASTGKKDKALELLSGAIEEINEAGALPRGSTASLNRTFELGRIRSTIVEALASAGRCDQALGQADTIANKIQKTFAREAIIRECAKAGLLEKALSIAETGELLPDSKAALILTLAAGFMESGQKTRTLQLLAEVEEMTPAVLDDNSRSKLLVDMAGEYAKAGLKEKTTDLLVQSEKIADTLQNPSIKAVRLAGIAETYHAIGNSAHLKRLLKRCSKTAMEIEVEGVHISTKARMAVSFSRAEKAAMALHMLDQALEIARTEPGQKNLPPGAGSASGQEKALIKFDLKALRIAEVAMRCCQAGFPDKAVEVADMIDSPYYKATALAGVASIILDPTLDVDMMIVRLAE